VSDGERPRRPRRIGRASRRIASRRRSDAARGDRARSLVPGCRLTSSGGSGAWHRTPVNSKSPRIRSSGTLWKQLEVKRLVAGGDTRADRRSGRPDRNDGFPGGAVVGHRRHDSDHGTRRRVRARGGRPRDTREDVDLQGMSTSGLTDAQIAERILDGHPAAASSVDPFLAAYGAALPRCLPRRQGRVMPGVRELLEDLSGDDRVLSLLATGNIEAGARANLRHYGLIDLIADGGFLPGSRGAGADRRRRASWEAQSRICAPPDRSRTFVIATLLATVECARRSACGRVAVATGEYAVDELAANGALRDVRAPAVGVRIPRASSGCRPAPQLRVREGDVVEVDLVRVPADVHRAQPEAVEPDRPCELAPAILV